MLCFPSLTQFVFFSFICILTPLRATNGFRSGLVAVLVDWGCEAFDINDPGLFLFQLSYIAGVFGIAFQWFHSDVENGAVGGNGQRSGDYVLLFLTEMGESIS